MKGIRWFDSGVDMLTNRNDLDTVPCNQQTIEECWRTRFQAGRNQKLYGNFLLCYGH